MYGSSNTGFDRSGAMGSSARVPFAARYGRLVVVLLVCLLASVGRAQATLDDVVNAIASMEGNVRGDLSAAAYTIADRLDTVAGQNHLAGVESLLSVMQDTMSSIDNAAFAIQWNTDSMMNFSYPLNNLDYYLGSASRGSSIAVSLEEGDYDKLKEMFGHAINEALSDWSDPDGEGGSLNVEVDPWDLDDWSVEDPDDFSVPDPEEPIYAMQNSFNQAQAEYMGYQADRQHIEEEFSSVGIWDGIKAKILGIYQAFSVDYPTGIHWSVGGWTLVNMSASDFNDWSSVRSVMPFVWGAVFLASAVQIIQRGLG